MKGLLKDITTGKDNETFDVVRVSMVAIISLLPFVLVWGIAMATLLAFGIIKMFDMNSAFTAIMTFCVAAGSLLMSGSASLFFKKSTEPERKVDDHNDGGSNSSKP